VALPPEGNATDLRNRLIHAQPYTSSKKIQQLGGGRLERPLKDFLGAANHFEEVAIEGSDNSYGDLATARP
jgi:hypothetical protein